MVSMVPARLGLGGRGYSVSGVWGGRAMAPMVSDGLDLGGRGYGVYGVWGWSGLWCLWCLMSWTWVVGAVVSLEC